MRNLPVLEMALPFPVTIPISSKVLFGGQFLKIFHLVQSPNWQSTILVQGVTHFFPFLVTGFAISGTVIHWAPYRNWTLRMWSNIQCRALTVRVRLFLGSHTGTGLYGCGLISGRRGLISGTGLCQFRVVFRVPYQNWTLCAWSHFRYQDLPVGVWLFLGSRTRTGLCMRWVRPLVGLWLVCAHFTFGGTMI
jgi:hypothetical protein